MAKQNRIKSTTGIYHVMLRGINKQQIFFDEDDYLCMQRVLADAHVRKGEAGKIASQKDCAIYAYCIMPNHVHILVREGESEIDRIMNKIETRFVSFYNSKYERVGHLFQGRFKSEPVEDDRYFKTLLRYIHQNPVVGILCKQPEQYRWSSWHEYLGHDVMIPVCLKGPVLKKWPLYELLPWVNDSTAEDKCMDMNSDGNPISELSAWEIIIDLAKVSSIEEFKLLDSDLQLKVLCEATNHGVSIRQASRLSSMSYRKLRNALLGDHLNSASRINVWIKGAAPLIHLSGQQESIIEYIKRNPSAMSTEISSKIEGITLNQARYALSKLQQYGILEKSKDNQGKFIWNIQQQV